MKKILFAMIILLSVTLIFSSCNSNDNSSDEKNNTNEIYMNQKGSWSNGVEFEILDHRITSEIKSSYVTYTTQNKFIVLKLQVYNGSSNAFSADATDVWLSVNGAKIYQQNFVERDVNGFSDINQSPTTTKYYYLIFEVGNDISMDDLKLVIHNGSLLNSEALVIKLKNSPKDCTVTLNYAYERENDAHNFYSGTTIYPSSFPTPEREGYEFLGWYFNADYSGDVLTDHTLEEKQTLTLYAKWKKIIHINYHYQYENKTESVLLEENTDYTLIVPSRLGYTFGGWFANSSYTGNAITKLSNAQNDVVVFAKWIGNPVSIIFDGNGATSGTMGNQAGVVGESKKLNANQYSKEGYAFLGWSLDSKDTVVYENQADFSIIPTDNETITLYAQWMPRQDIPYTINHYLQNAYDDGYTLKHTFDKIGVADSSISPAPSSYEGFTSPNVKTVTVAANGSLVIDYYYTRNNYTVTFVVNGGTSSLASITQKYETTFDLPTVERIGYTFGGWFADPALTTPLSISNIPSENISIYVWWQEENKPSEFTYSGTNAITIKSYIGESETVCVPSYIGGVCVKEIFSYAFQNQALIRKVIVPNSVTSIGSGAFNGMTALEEISIPFVGTGMAASNARFGEIFGSTYNVNRGKTSSADTTDQGYYYRYTYTVNGYNRVEDRYVSYYIPKSLRKVTITVQTEIPESAFMNCDLLEEIVFLHDITYVAQKAFYECQRISKLNLGNNVIVINDMAFYNCTNLSSFNSEIEGCFALPSNLTSIGVRTFQGCTKVSSVLCGDVISQIGHGAFSDCSSITSFNSNETGALVIPHSVTEIESNAFSGLIAITKLIVPNSVTSIGSGAFNGMTALEEISIPFVGTGMAASNVRFGEIFGSMYNVNRGKTSSADTTDQGYYYRYTYTVNGYNRVEDRYVSYYIPKSLRKVTITVQTEIPESAFMNCDLLEEIILPQNITSIGKQAFYMCSSISEINIGNSLESIGELAFAGCNNLKKIQIPVSVTTINGYAFRNCVSLTIIYQGEIIPSTWDIKWNDTNCTVVMGESKK